MNRSRYVNRPIDKTDRAIIAALFENGRMTFRELAELIDLSSPSVAERFNKLKDAGAIRGFLAIVDPKVFGHTIAAHLRISAMPGEVKRAEQMLKETPQVIEADRVTGENCFLAKISVTDVDELQMVVDRFAPFASTDVAIVQSTTVARRLPKL
jgi:Lrp/AsnC family transcriptional regulator, leucine-responsive regulatory protein